MALVRVEDFWMDQTEVTNGQYQRCVAAGACSLPAEYSSNKVPNYYGNPTYAQFPVTKIDISAARAYCAWAGRRLLTLAQWQTAARGLDNRPYATGAQATCTLANLNDCFGDPIQVASFPAGAYGIYDMVGNVYEWIDTPREDGYAVMGGSWFDDADAARTDRVRWRYANATSSKLGFRCVQP
jgi:formylglycine-generating enzyme required for sulfatase activity